MYLRGIVSILEASPMLEGDMGDAITLTPDIDGPIMNEPANQATTQEEFDRLRSLSQGQHILTQ